MASYIDKGDTSGVDPKLLKSTLEMYKGNADSAANHLNTYGAQISPSERKVYQDMYKDAVKSATDTATKLGVVYKAPEVRSAALIDGKVAGAGSSMLATKANDLLTTVDGYGKSLEQNLTAISNSVKNNLAAAKDWMFNTEIPGVGSLSDIKKKADSLNSQLTDMAEQVSSAIDRPVGQLKGMTDGILNTSFSALDDLNAELAGNNLTSFGGNTYLAALGAKVPAVNKLIDSYNGIKGAKEAVFDRVRDFPAELSMRLAVLDQAGRLGLTDLMDHIIKNGDKGHEQYYHVALIDQFDSALGSGDLNIIDKMVAQLGAVTVVTRYPDAIQRILRGYRHPVKNTAAQWPTELVQMKATLTSIDARWEFNSRVTNVNLINLNVFNGASDDTVDLFRTDKQYYRRILVARNFAGVSGASMISQVKSVYPYAAIST